MIKAPNFCKNAVPTLRGWCHPKTGELLKSQRITQSQIDEWYNVGLDITEEENDVSDLELMTKKELEEFARDHGVELDRRFSKAKLLDQVTSLFKS
jgi:hypothetical protein